jgi:hypothetical protein
MNRGGFRRLRARRCRPRGEVTPDKKRRRGQQQQHYAGLQHAPPTPAFPSDAFLFRFCWDCPSLRLRGSFVLVHRLGRKETFATVDDGIQETLFQQKSL